MSRTPPPTVGPLDLERYLGTWYEIARLPMRHEPPDYRDITASYSRDEEGAVRVVNRAVDGEGKRQESVGQARPVDPADPSRLEVSFLPDGLRWIPFSKGDYWILRLDPEYRTSLVGSPDYKYLWLLHREPTLDPAIRQSYLETARELGYRLDDLIDTPQSPDRG